MQMLIRKPAHEVFNAFIDPDITRHFWFSQGSGPLEMGKIITWKWEWYAVSTQVIVKEIIPHTLIAIDWDEPSTHVRFNFQAVNDQQTYVVIEQSGFHQKGDELVKVMLDSVGGFTTVLDGLKAYLEHGIDLRLIPDKFLKK